MSENASKQRSPAVNQKKHFVDIKRYQFKTTKDNVGCENVVKTSLVDNIVAENICHTNNKIVHYPNKLPLDKQSSILTNVDKEYELLYLEKQNAKLCKRINQTAELIDAIPIQPLETVEDIQSDVSKILKNEIKRVNAAATQEMNFKLAHFTKRHLRFMMTNVKPTAFIKVMLCHCFPQH